MNREAAISEYQNQFRVFLVNNIKNNDELRKLFETDPNKFLTVGLEMFHRFRMKEIDKMENIKIEDLMPFL